MSKKCPLTGAAAGKHDKPGRTALAVKIDNIAPALPQAGLNSADIVVEEEVEGGLTRLFAVFQCQQATNIGPIRSARTTDADLLALLHGSVFAFSGDNPAVLPPIEKYGHAAFVVYDSNPSNFTLDTSREAPHDVFSSSTRLLAAGRRARKAAHHKPAAAPPPLFRYGPLDHRARRAHSATMSWPAASARWSWNGMEWVRTQDGVTDRLTNGRTASARNVVVLTVKLTSTGIRDVAGNPSPDSVTVGSGRAWVLRDGHVIAGKWKRKSPANRWHLTDRAGKPIDLTPGRTWVELLPDASSFSTS